MSKRRVISKAEAEKVVKDIRRATCSVHSAEETGRMRSSSGAVSGHTMSILGQILPSRISQILLESAASDPRHPTNWSGRIKASGAP